MCLTREAEVARFSFTIIAPKVLTRIGSAAAGGSELSLVLSNFSLVIFKTTSG